MISLLYPIRNRLGPFKETINSILDTTDSSDIFEIIVLDSKGDKDLKEFIIESKKQLDITYINYKYPGLLEVHNPSYAFNLGSNIAKYNSIILTSPEVKHETNVIKQLLKLTGENILCRVVDLDTNNKIRQVLMGTEVPTRGDDPGMYFIGMYNKADYQSIGGLDEKFMQGLGWEDRDFGRRFKAKFKFRTLDYIKGIHQYHPRPNQHTDLFNKNVSVLRDNEATKIIKVNTGIKMGNPEYIVEKV